MDLPNSIERAYQLAVSGQFNSLTEVLKQLKREGYTDSRAQLQSEVNQRAIRQLFAQARRRKAGA